MKKIDLPLEQFKKDPVIFTDQSVLDAIVKDIETELGWKNLIGSTRTNLKLILPIIQRHLKG
jgi:hypothetical protein